jgi:hypothetical protein
MKKFKMKNRLKIPNRVAALAAVTLLVTGVAGPGNPDDQLITAQQVTDAVEETTAELATAAASVRKPGSFNISSLIFRF